MKKSLVVLMVLAAAIAGALTWAALFLEGGTDPVESIRDVMPDSVVYYAEAEDLAGTWSQVRETEAFDDLERSSLWLDEEGPVREMLDTLESVSAQVDYPLDDKNLMKFLGKRAGVGVALDTESSRLARVVVTRIDLKALATDLLSGNMDWRALQEELNARSQKAEFELVTRDYRGYSVTTARKGQTILYWTLLEDVLVVAEARPLLDAAVDARLDGSGALSSSAVFTTEVERLEGEPTAFDWTHLAAIEAQRDLTRTCWNNGWANSQKEARPWIFDPLLDAVKGCSALARAYEVPAGDLYQARWSYSRPAGEIFADSSSPPLSAIAAADTTLYMEGRRLGELVRAWESSDLAAALGDAPLSEKIDDALADPESAMKKMLSLAPMPIDPPDLGGASIEFQVRFAMNGVRRGIESIFQGDVAVATGRIPSGIDTPQAVAAVRLGIDGRFLFLLATGVEKARSFGRVGEHTLYGIGGDGEREAYSALIGDALVFGPDLEQTRKAGAALAASQAPAGIVADAKSHLGDDDHMLAVMDVRSLMEDVMRDQSDFGGAFTPRDFYAARYYAFAATIPEDFSEIEIRYDYPMAPDAGELIRKITLNTLVGTSRLLELGPADTMLLAAYNYDATDALRLVRGMALSLDGGENAGREFDEGVAAADEFLGLNLEKDLLPALKGEIGAMVVREEAVEGTGEPPIPGIVVVIGYDDPAPVLKAVGAVADAIGEQIEQSAGQGGPQQRMLKEEIGGRVFRTLDLGGELGPIQPTFGVLDEYVVIGSKPEVVRAFADVLGGQAPGWKDAPRIARARSGLPSEYSALSMVDWAGVMTQLEAFVDPVARMASSVPPPEYPTNGDMEEWQRRVKAYEEEVESAGKETGNTVRAVLDTLALIESMTTWQGADGDHAIGATTIRFKQSTESEPR